MQRDVQALTATTFDVLVVGGGVYGLTIACDAAQRGLSVALIDRGDFGSGSSFNHLRTIHGGLRYLQSLAIGRSRTSIRERRTLARIAPHTIEPLLFALPLYRSFTRGRLAMRAGFLLDRLVSYDRNQRVPDSHRLPAGRVVSLQDAIERFPGLRRRGMTGAATWSDYVTIEADRLTFSWAIAAAGHGAALANYVEARSWLTDGRRVTGVTAADGVSGRPLEIGARVTVNAAGAGTEDLLAPLGAGARLPMLKAMNLVTRRDAGDGALGGLSPSGRSFFLVPWRNRAVFGTWESPAPTSAADSDERDILSFISELNHSFPALELTLKDVSLVHRGIVPAVTNANGSVTLEATDRIRDHAAQGVEGLVSVNGTKYTVARAVAERITDILQEKLGRPVTNARTATTVLPGGDVGDPASAIAEARRDYDHLLPPDTIPHLVHAYGSRYRDVLDGAGGRNELLQRLDANSPVIGAEILWAARHEMALTLADAVIRRTPLGALGHPGDGAAEKAAAIVAAELEWSEERRQEELSQLRAFYSPF